MTTGFDADRDPPLQLVANPAQAENPSRRRLISRVVCGVLYATFARRLPWSSRPLGRVSRRLRGWLARGMLDFCGHNVNVDHGAVFGSGRGIRLGDRSDIGVDAVIMGPVDIGKDVMMGPRCILLAGAHVFSDTERPMNIQGMAPDRVIRIEDDVWIGAGATVLPGRVLGRGCIVGAGSVVTHDVEPYAIVGGNPARPVGSRLGSGQQPHQA